MLALSRTSRDTLERLDDARAVTPPDALPLIHQAYDAVLKPIEIKGNAPIGLAPWHTFSLRMYQVHPNRMTRWLDQAFETSVIVDGAYLHIWTSPGVHPGSDEEDPWLDDEDILLMAQICNLVHMFHHLVASLEGTHLYVSLYDEERVLPPHPSINGGLSVSGWTVGENRSIFASKRQDICRLLLHELCHLVGLDRSLRQPWRGKIRTREPGVQSEVWVEYVSVYLWCIWLHLTTGRPLEQLWYIELEHNCSVMYNLACYWETDLDAIWNGEVTVQPPIPVVEYIFYRYLLMYYSVRITDKDGQFLLPDDLELEKYPFSPVILQSKLPADVVGYTALYY